jgi:Spy/CpxP family protein refolding chaperone
MNERGNTRLKILLAVLGVFALGCVTGASLDSVYRLQASSGGQSATMGQPGKEDFFESLRRNLNLNNQQATEIRAIVDETRGEYRQLRAEVRPRYDTIRQKARTRIRALLAPDQQQKFDTMVAQRDARRDEEEKNRP